MRERYLDQLTSRWSHKGVVNFKYNWGYWARDEQLPPPGDWAIWLMLAGRGWGKTRALCEWVRDIAEAGQHRRIAIVGRTAADVRDVLIEGESGILAISRPNFMPEWNGGKRRLTWPNGVIATTYSSENPQQLRGPQHDAAACDELAAWRYVEAWDNLMFGLRLGDNPRCVVATTPRPTPLIKSLVADRNTVTTSGSTYENQAHLAPSFFTRIIAKYEGTRLGLQELYAKILADNPLALWKREMIHYVREIPEFTRIVVGVDPQAKAVDGSSETGIVVAGLSKKNYCYILEDATVTGSPRTWAEAVVTAYHKYKADRIVAELNQGGDMVMEVLRTVEKNLPCRGVHASRGKKARAEPVASLYEQGRILHVGSHAKLEDEMCEWVPGEGDSPDRVDALVWSVSELLLRETGQPSPRNAVGYDTEFLDQQRRQRGPVRAELDEDIRVTL